MRTIRRILVAVKDPLARSQPAIAKAAQLARALHASLDLFHDLDTVIFESANRTIHDEQVANLRKLQARSISRLEAIAEPLRKQGLAVTLAAEFDFPAYEAIIRRARHTGADLIVAQSHKGHRIAPSLLRLTDWELLRRSPVPVLLLKSPRAYRQPAVLAAIDPTHAFAKPSGLDDAILSAATSVQAALRGTLHVVHAFAPLSTIVVTPGLLATPLEAAVPPEFKAAAATRFNAALQGLNIPRSRRHFVARHPQDAIPQVARSTRSAIVVMGDVSRSGLKRVFIGNTAERVLDELACDVLVVKPLRFACPVPMRKRGFRVSVPMPF